MRQRRNSDWKPMQPYLHGRMDEDERERRLEAEEFGPAARFARRREEEFEGAQPEFGWDLDEPRHRRRRNDALAACSRAKTLEQLVRALRSLRPEEAERLLESRPRLPAWGAKPRFLAEDVLSWDTRSRRVQLLVTFRRTPGGRVIFSQREEWAEALFTRGAVSRGPDAFEDARDLPMFNGRCGERGKRGGRG